MPRKNYKTRGYDPITRKRIVYRWSDEKLRQVSREARNYNEEVKAEKERQKGE